MIRVHGSVKERKDKMTKKNYTKYSESSEVTNVEPTVENENEEIKVLDVTSMTDEEKTERIETVLEIRSSEGVDKELYDTLTEELTVLGYVEPENEEETKNDEPDAGEEPEVDEDHTGDICPAKVMGCTKLNVREEPSKDSKVVCVITEESDLTVSNDLSTEEFYKVYTSVNDVLYEGYCMKKFIQID